MDDWDAVDTRAERFPEYGSIHCTHPVELQRRDGRGVVCLNCGAIRVMW